MTITYHEVIKRDGFRRERFDANKIVMAILKAAAATQVEIDCEVIRREVVMPIEVAIMKEPLDIERIQDMVETALMKNYPRVGKAYILYRDKRHQERTKRGSS